MVQMQMQWELVPISETQMSDAMVQFAFTNPNLAISHDYAVAERLLLKARSETSVLQAERLKGYKCITSQAKRELR